MQTNEMQWNVTKVNNMYNEHGVIDLFFCVKARLSVSTAFCHIHM